MLAELFEGCLQLDKIPPDREDLSSLPACKGIIAFFDSNTNPIQILSVANIRRTASARLQPPDDDDTGKRANIASITRKLYYLCCYNNFKCSLEYNRLTHLLFPDRSSQLIKLPSQNFVKINLDDKWPNLSLTDKPYISRNERIFGLFPTKKAANEFILNLRNAFRICQRPKLIASPQKAKSCPYLQMQKCPAPCMGKINKNEYIQSIEHAVSCACGQYTDYCDALEKQMALHSNQLEFEQAEDIKKRLTQFESLKGRQYFWTNDLTKLAVLHIDKSAKIQQEGKRKKVQTWAAYLIRYGNITEFENFTLENIDTFYKNFINTLAETPICDNELLKEQLALTAFYIFRDKPQGIWLNCQKTPTLEEIKDSINTAV